MEDDGVAIERILDRATVIATDRASAQRWLGEPLPTFGGKTPLDLARAGRIQDVLDYLDSIATGYLG